MPLQSTLYEIVQLTISTSSALTILVKGLTPPPPTPQSEGMTLLLDGTFSKQPSEPRVAVWPMQSIYTTVEMHWGLALLCLKASFCKSERDALEPNALRKQS